DAEDQGKRAEDEAQRANVARDDAERQGKLAFEAAEKEKAARTLAERSSKAEETLRKEGQQENQHRRNKMEELDQKAPRISATLRDGVNAVTRAVFAKDDKREEQIITLGADGLRRWNTSSGLYEEANADLEELIDKEESLVSNNDLHVRSNAGDFTLMENSSGKGGNVVTLRNNKTKKEVTLRE